MSESFIDFLHNVDESLAFCEIGMSKWPSNWNSPTDSSVNGDRSGYGIYVFSFAVIDVLAFLLLLNYIRIQNALTKEQENVLLTDSKRLIFPLYVKILWVIAIVELITAGMLLALQYWHVSLRGNLKFCLVYGICWGFFHSVYEGLAFLLMGHGVGRQSTRSAALYASIWALFTGGCNFFAMYYGGKEGLWIELAWTSVVFIFYTLLWLVPDRHWHRRPTLYSYSAFWTIGYFVLLSSILLRMLGANIGFCLFELSPVGLLSLMTPYIVYNTLLLDSRYWQGMLTFSPKNSTKIIDGQVGEQKSSGVGNIRDPLLGTFLGPKSAREIARHLDQSQYEFDTGITGGIKVLNWSLLKVDKLANEYASNRERHVVLGAGSVSRVFRGTYEGKSVAIKMIFCPDLTPETVSNFVREASLLARLVHKNVVRILGVCVLPPSICLVMELCPGGNLYDHIRVDGGQLVANFATKLRLMRDCAAAVNFLHAQSPPILHLDLKSSNFLIGKHREVKVADLELSREIVITELQQSTQEDDDPGEGKAGKRGPKTEADESKPLKRNTESGVGLAHGSDMTGFRVPDTLNWLAPEIIMGRKYDTKADVYSLVMVLWEILTGEVPYSSLKSEIDKRHSELDRYSTIVASELADDTDVLPPSGSFQEGMYAGSVDSSVHSLRNTNAFLSPARPTRNKTMPNSAESARKRSDMSTTSVKLDFGTAPIAISVPTGNSDLEDGKEAVLASTAESGFSDSRFEAHNPYMVTKQASRTSDSEFVDADAKQQFSYAPSEAESLYGEGGSSLYPNSVDSSRGDTFSYLQHPSMQNSVLSTNTAGGMVAFSPRQSDVRAEISTPRSTATKKKKRRNSWSGRGGVQQRRVRVRLNATQTLLFRSRDNTERALKHAICTEHYRPVLPHGLPDELISMMQAGWHPDPRQRPSAHVILEVLDRLIELEKHEEIKS